MLLLLSVLIALLAIGSFISGLLALLSNSGKAQNRWFFVFTTFLAIWIPSNFIDSNFLTGANFFLKLDFTSALFIAWSFVEFATVFKLRSVSFKEFKFSQNILRSATFILNLVFTVTILGGILINSTVSNKVLNITYSKLFYLYAAVFVAYVLYAYILLFVKRSKAQLEEKPAVNTIFIGTLIAAITNILTNLVFPIVISSDRVVKDLNVIGYIGLVIMVGSVYLAITTQRLFDIRLLVTRSLAYVLSWATLGGLFVFATFTVSSIIFKNNLSSFEVRWIYTILAVALALVFTPLKRFFDKNTNRLFYRDAYDSESFLDLFNKNLVITYELEPLLRKSAEIVETNLKPIYTVFDIKETSNTSRRIIGTTGHAVFTEKDIVYIRTLTPVLRRKLIVVDELEDKFKKLQEILRSNNVSVMARLATSINEEGVGYLVLGPKKSGNPYSSQDLNMVEIVANELVIAIQNSLRFEEIQNFNLTLQQRVVEATKQLRRTNERLKSLDETKDDFISMASHQLRTPLTSVKGYLSMVLEGDAGKVNTTQTKMLHQAFISSQRMVFLITDLLNVSRLKTGKFVIENTPVDLSKLIQEEVSQLVETAQVKQIDITYKKPDTFPLLMLDETKIRQVGMNFMDNAIYYTPIGGHINVELINNPMTVELRVTDNGIGVPKSEQHHLFTKFYRATNARKTRPDGTGLGLFMAKKVIAAQGGSIIFDSKDGQGSTFGFVFSKTKLKVPESLVSTGGGTRLEGPELSTQKPKTKSLTPVR